MFGTHDSYYYTDRPLASAKGLFEALCLGRTPEEVQKTGTILSPHDLAYDAMLFQENTQGPILAAPSFFSMAVAAIRHGNLDLLIGMASRADFFEDPPNIELREIRNKHENRCLSSSCLLEAATRCRVDILDALSNAANAKLQSIAQSPDGQSRRGWHASGALAQPLAQINPKDADDLAYWIGSSRNNDAKSIQQTSAWISARLEPPLHPRYAKPEPFAQKLLTQSCSHGNDAGIEAALSMGALPSFTNASSAARLGSLQWAKKLSKIAKPGKPENDSRQGYGRDDENPTPCITSDMADSHLVSLDSIANGHFEYEFLEESPRSREVRSREVTWANYDDHRMNLLEAQLGAISGDFDLPCNTEDELRLGKGQVARVARCMALLHKDTEASLARIEALNPPACPSSSEEMVFLARLGHASLLNAMQSAHEPELDLFARRIAKNFTELRDSATRSERHRNEAFKKTLRLQNSHIENAIFDSCEWLDEHRPKSEAKSILFGVISNAGLGVAYETRVLSKASVQGTPKRRILKA